MMGKKLNIVIGYLKEFSQQPRMLAMIAVAVPGGRKITFRMPGERTEQLRLLPSKHQETTLPFFNQWRSRT